MTDDPAVGQAQVLVTDGQPQGPGPQVPPAAKTSRRALKNWRVRSRLLLLITIPTLTAVVLGGLRIVSSVQSALSYQRVEQLAKLSSAVTSLASKLEDERDQTVAYIALGTDGGRAAELAGQKNGSSAQLSYVRQLWAETNPWAARVRAQVAAIGGSGSYPSQVRRQAQAINAELGELNVLRQASVGTKLPPLIVISKYSKFIGNLLSIDGNIALNSSDTSLSGTVRELSLISQIEEETSQQRAILMYAFTQGGFGPGVLNALEAAQAETNANIQQFDDAATPAQLSLYNNTVSGSLVDFANGYELQATNYGQNGKPLADSTTTPEEWNGAMSGKLAAMRTVEQKLVSAAIARASSLRRSAIITAVLVGSAVIIVLVLALLLTALVGRSMVRPLRRLRAGALEVAGLRLPETVRRMSETDGTGIPLDVDPIDVDSSDEIGEVARAFDQVHREALRLAANEAALRGNVNAMFVNLSRRSQSLVERQIRLIDDLEQGEQDSERLSSLFRMDHLATRMRRNSENLLVLAGHDASRRWNQPVALIDVMRAAVSEIEQYERVSLNVQPGIAVRGQAVNDVVHLLAELAENATSFSSAETPVVISGHLLNSGGVLLDITDQGVGMGAEEMAHANWRLDNPPVVDVAVSRRMGLFVVARLAARHGIRVRLRPAAAGGLTALVWLPDEVISPDGQGTAPRRGDALVTGFTAAQAGIGLGELADDERSATEQEVDAARAPKFASLSADQEDDQGLGPRRIPGAGPRPGAPAETGAGTGPLPVFRTSPQPASQSGRQPFAAEGKPAERSERLIIGPPSLTDPDSPGTGQRSFADDERLVIGPQSGTSNGSGTGPWPAEEERLGTGSEPAAAAETAAAADAGLQWVAGDRSPATGEQSAADSGQLADTGQQAAFDAPFPGSNGDADGQKHDTGRRALAAFGWERSTSEDGVVVPPAGPAGTDNRLPIFEAVESDWFRRGRSNFADWESPQPAEATTESPAWTSPADDGWTAAEAVSSPSSAGVTTAGLPKRVPQANLVPGSAAVETQAVSPARSAAATRERFANFQRGLREGRAALGADESRDGDDQSS